MNIEEIKEYLNSKKDKIKSGAVKATSTALVAGMLLSGGLGLTGCVKDPNNPNNTTVITDPNNKFETTEDPDRLGDPDYVKQEFTRPLEEYTTKEKFDICIENYMLTDRITYDLFMLVPEVDLAKGEKYVLVNPADGNKIGYTDCNFKLDYSIYEQVKKALGTNDNLIYVSTENKELCDLIFNDLYAKYKDTDREQERQKKLEQAKNPTTPKTFAEKLDKYNEELVDLLVKNNVERKPEIPCSITNIKVGYGYSRDYSEEDGYHSSIHDNIESNYNYIEWKWNFRRDYDINSNGEKTDVKYESSWYYVEFPIDEDLMSKIASVVPGDYINDYKLERTLDNREQWEKLCEIIAPYLAEKFPVNEQVEEMTR